MDIKELHNLVEEIKVSNSIDDVQLSKLDAFISSYKDMTFRLDICKDNRTILVNKINKERGWGN